MIGKFRVLSGMDKLVCPWYRDWPPAPLPDRRVEPTPRRESRFHREGGVRAEKKDMGRNI